MYMIRGFDEVNEMVKVRNVRSAELTQPRQDKIWTATWSVTRPVNVDQWQWTKVGWGDVTSLAMSRYHHWTLFWVHAVFVCVSIRVCFPSANPIRYNL